MIELLRSAALVEEMTAVQAEAAAALRSKEIVPKLAIVEGLGTTALTGEIKTYVGGKLCYMASVGIDTVHFPLPIIDIPNRIGRLNDDPTVHAIIVEVPMPFENIGDDATAKEVRKGLTAIILDQIYGAKAIDSQGKYTRHNVGATAEATVTLLDRYGHTGDGEHVLIVGKGNVGSDVYGIYSHRPVRDLSVVDLGNSDDLPGLSQAASMIIVATGMPGTLTPDLVRNRHVIAGVGAQDIHPDVYDIDDGRTFSITPQKGGVGPATICVAGKRVLHEAAQLVTA